MIKKILSIVVLGLLICNTGFSKIYEMNNCYVYKFSDGSTTSSWDEYKKKIYNETNEDYSDVIYSINLDTGTVSQIVKYSNGLVKFNDFIIQNYSSDFIVALHEKVNNKLTIDLKNLKVQSYIKINTSIRVSFTQCINRSDTTETSEEGGSSGTAFFVSNRGHLITNNHVVEGCSVSKITYKNSDYDTKLIATDKNLDLALLKAEIRPKSFFNFSKDDIKKLNKVYVAGYPLGKGLSDDLKISSGIVSSLKGYKDNSNEIQIDAQLKI